MEEKKTAGKKEFFIAVVWAIFLFTVSQYIGAAMQSYHIIANLIGVLMFCVLGFFVLTRYCAVFTYTVGDERVRINRLIGHHNKEVDFAISNIVSIRAGNTKTDAKTTLNMTTKAFSKTGTCCIVYNKTGVNEAVIFEPSGEMLLYIKKQLKKVKHNEERSGNKI